MRKSSRTILGIDPGIAKLGFGIIRAQGSQLTLVDFGVITTGQRLVTGDRLKRIHEKLLHLFALHHPDMIVIEKLFFTKNVTTAMVVGEARGVALLASAEANVPILQVTPTAVKQAVTGYGRADKRQIQRMLQMTFRLPRVPQPDDAADAIALAMCGSNSFSI